MEWENGPTNTGEEAHMNREFDIGKTNKLQLADIERVTPELAREGGLLAYDNAVSLMSDAWVLFEHERFPRLYALAQMASEELGKAHLLSRLCNALLWEDATIAEEQARVLDAFQRHPGKAWWGVILDLTEEARRPDQTPQEHIERVLEDLDATKKHRYSRSREASLYLDFDGTQFLVPLSKVTMEIAVGHAHRVQVRLDSFASTDLHELRTSIDEQRELIKAVRESKEGDSRK